VHRITILQRGQRPRRTPSQYNDTGNLAHHSLPPRHRVSHNRWTSSAPGAARRDRPAPRMLRQGRVYLARASSRPHTPPLSSNASRFPPRRPGWPAGSRRLRDSHRPRPAPLGQRVRPPARHLNCLMLGHNPLLRLVRCPGESALTPLPDRHARGHKRRHHRLFGTGGCPPFVSPYTVPRRVPAAQPAEPSAHHYPATPRLPRGTPQPAAPGPAHDQHPTHDRKTPAPPQHRPALPAWPALPPASAGAT